MTKDSLQFFPLLILILALALLGFIWYQSDSFEKAYLTHTKNELLIRNQLLKPKIEKYLSENNLKALNELSKSIDKDIDTRITVIDDKGKVLCDSRGQVDLMSPHLTRDRKEIIDAFQGKSSTSIRNSSTLSTRMIYAAIPIKSNSKTYVLRSAMSIAQIDNILKRSRRDILVFGLLVAIAVSILSYFIVSSIRKPIKALRINAARIAGGDLDTTLPIPAKGAIYDLALSLNNMAEQLKKRLEQLYVEKKKRDAIFASMTEGVIALDLSGNILDINRAAIEMLELPANANGLSFYTLVDNDDLLNVVGKIIKKKELVESELTLNLLQERHVRICGTVLSSKGNIFGAVIVFYDVTQVKKLENFRHDFIADVSHEIKTPLTAIRGAVETLAEGAIEEPENADKFMKIITKHSDRLNSLVHDILSLSSLEIKTDARERDFANLKIASIINTACEICQERADNKDVKFKVYIEDESYQIEGDCQLLEQALINLIENAIKYSESSDSIEINAAKKDNNILIEVQDHGTGIAAKHLPRLFERFYRIDKARSRKLGGTGLGLAIVKHIAQLHKGSISVESELGKGSKFTLRLPIKQNT
jgi:two-component system, OmpR family, phosphate regulon sensor histidine kinase PhoR